MSHYPVAVFTRGGIHEVDDLLAPYDESIRIAPYVRYTKERLVQREKEHFQQVVDGPYAEWKKNPETYEKLCTNPVHISHLAGQYVKIR